MYRGHQQPLRYVAHVSSVAHSGPSVALADVFCDLLQITVVHFPHPPVVASVVRGSSNHVIIVFALETGIRDELVWDCA